MLNFFLKLSKPEFSEAYFKTILSPHFEITRRTGPFLRNKTTGTPSPIDGLILHKATDAEEFEPGGRYENYLQIMFVRNPLERLLSAWQDRFIDKP